MQSRTASAVIMMKPFAGGVSIAVDGRYSDWDRVKQSETQMFRSIRNLTAM